MRSLLMILFVLGFTCSGIGQPTDLDFNESLFSNMPGIWSGQGKYMDENRVWIDTRVKEVVENRLNGLVLTVEGKGFRLNDDSEENPVHHAFGMMHFDPQDGTLKMRAVLKDGRWVDPVIKLTDGGFNWSFEVSGGTIEYHVALDGERWNEKGYFCRGEEKWPFFEMELIKQPEN